jgi:hypothetical protein
MTGQNAPPKTLVSPTMLKPALTHARRLAGFFSFSR